MKEKKEKDNVTFLDDVEPRKRVKPEDKQLMALKGDLPVGVTQEQLNEMLQKDLQRTIQGVIPRLPQIRILHAGTLRFQLPSDDLSEPNQIKEFEGIIIDQHPCNAWWEQSFAESGGGVPPTCSSLDGKDGTKAACLGCPQNQFGSAKDDRGNATKGKACKNMKRLHVLLPGCELPYRLTLPPSSIKEVDTFFSFLLNKRIPMTTIKVKFSLADATSSGGIHYSQIRFEAVDQIDIEQYMAIQKFLKEHLASIRGQEILAEEYASEPNGSTSFNPEELE